MSSEEKASGADGSEATADMDEASAGTTTLTEEAPGATEAGTADDTADATSEDTLETPDDTEEDADDPAERADGPADDVAENADGTVPDAADDSDAPAAETPANGTPKDEPEPADEPEADALPEDPAEEPVKDSAKDDSAEKVGEPEKAAVAMASENGAGGATKATENDISRIGGKGAEKARSRRSRITRRALFVLLGATGLFLLAFGVAYAFTPVPSPQRQAIAQGPTFYYSDGKTRIAKTGVNRDAVDLDQIPKSVRDAVIAAENRSFYQDPGVSLKGTARAFWSTATGEQLQGGSTITQQMVRNYYGGIGKERSVTRKLKEIMVALKIGREKDKDWILEQYLNTIYFGRDAYGVQAAAKAYFGKDVSALTAAEGAYLAAAIQQPSNFADPSGGQRAYAELRWRAVLGNMVRDGALTDGQAAALTFPTPVKQRITDILKGQRGYMVNLAKKELVEKHGYTEDEINRSGLKITTTFDKKLMDAAKRAVTSSTPKKMSRSIRTAVVSIDPATGQVVAFYGGRDYLTEAMTSGFGDWAQVGSSFKPIALAAALDNGGQLTDTYDGSSPQKFAGHDVENDRGENFGMIDLVYMTEHSVNTAYVNLGQDVGNRKIAEMAEKMGIPPARMTPEQRQAAVFPLGVSSMHPVEMAGVYSTFAAEGVYRTPYVVKSVADNGDHTRTFTVKGERAFSAQVARDATYAMQRVVRRGTGRNAQLADGRDVAGKTGTTDKGRAIWFNGYVPQLATTVAMFRSDGKKLDIPGYGSYGGQLPARIWNAYTSEAVTIAGFAQKEFGEPSEYTGGYERPTYPARPDTPTETRPEDEPTRTPPSTEPKPSKPEEPTPDPTVVPTGPGDGGGGDGGDGGGGDDGGGDGGGQDPDRPGNS